MNPTLDSLSDPVTLSVKVNLFVYRLDRIHPVTGGNKIFKLNYLLNRYGRLSDDKKPVLIGFGGCYSNLIAALARFGSVHGFKTAGIIRGEPPASPCITLKRAAADGMQLHFVSRTLFHDKRLCVQSLLSRFNYPFTEIIPQGAAGFGGYEGCKHILKPIHQDFDYIVCPSATGTTLAGLACSAGRQTRCIGISVLKNREEQQANILRFLLKDGRTDHTVSLTDEYTEGGFAKKSVRLTEFLLQFNKLHPDIPAEPVYSGKMFFGIYDLMKKGFFEKHSRILAIHTGGLQYLMKE